MHKECLAYISNPQFLRVPLSHIEHHFCLLILGEIPFVCSSFFWRGGFTNSDSEVLANPEFDPAWGSRTGHEVWLVPFRILDSPMQCAKETSPKGHGFGRQPKKNKAFCFKTGLNQVDENYRSEFRIHTVHASRSRAHVELEFHSLERDGPTEWGIALGRWAIFRLRSLGLVGPSAVPAWRKRRDQHIMRKAPKRETWRLPCLWVEQDHPPYIFDRGPLFFK